MKKHANIYDLKGNLIGRIIYYSYSYDNTLIRFFGKDNKIIAQFFRGLVIIELLEDKEELNYVNE